MVRAGFAQLLLPVVPTRDAYADRVRSMGRHDVFRSVAQDEDASRVDRRAEDLTGTSDCLARQLSAIGRVGAVAAEREEAVQVGPRQLDVRRSLDRSGRDPQQKAGSAEPWEQLVDAGENLVARRVRHLLR